MAVDFQELTRLTQGRPLVIERVRLADADVAIEGRFELPPLAQLSAEDQVFVAAFVHCHGSIKKVLAGFIEMGVDVLHPFEAPPMGDVTAAEAKEMARGRLCLEGNIQIADLYEQTPEAIREQTAALIADAFDDRRGLIVCPTASLYIRGAGRRCFPQVKAMVETVLRRRP